MNGCKHWCLCCLVRFCMSEWVSFSSLFLTWCLGGVECRWVDVEL